MVPAYLATDCQLVSDEGRRQLRSANSRACVVRRTNNRSYGNRCFAAVLLWNTLLAHLRQTGISLKQFKRLLTTFYSGVEVAAHCG